MPKEKIGGVTPEEADILRRVRKQRKAVDLARQRYDEVMAACTTVRAQRYDRVPGGSRTSCGLERHIIKADSMRRMLEHAEEKLKCCIDEAMNVIERLPLPLFCFCLYYYVEGMAVEETARMIDRTERTCWRYKQIIERGEDAV